MATGEVPYDGDSPLQVMLRHMNDPVPDVRDRVPGLSDGTRALVQRMMAKVPEDRFPSPRELHEAIVQVERHLAGGAPPTFAGRPRASTTETQRRLVAQGVPAAPADDGAAKNRELGERLRKIVGKKRRA
jgi:hypothetical protein